jgi:subtilase family serine protease
VTPGTWYVISKADFDGRVAELGVNDTVENGGAGGAGPSTTRFYLSADSALDSGDAPLGTRSVPGLGPGQTSAGTTTVVIAAGTAPGSCFLLALADDGGAVSELDESNNARSRAFTVR